MTTTVKWKVRVRKMILITVRVTQRKKRPQTMNKLDPQESKIN